MQEYIVIEIQMNEAGTTSTITTAYSDMNIALQSYYTILAAAAVSALPVHGAMVMNVAHPDGYAYGIIAQQIFRREKENEGT